MVNESLMQFFQSFIAGARKDFVINTAVTGTDTLIATTAIYGLHDAIEGQFSFWAYVGYVALATLLATLQDPVARGTIAAIDNSVCHPHATSYNTIIEREDENSGNSFFENFLAGIKKEPIKNTSVTGVVALFAAAIVFMIHYASEKPFPVGYYFLYVFLTALVAALLAPPTRGLFNAAKVYAGHFCQSKASSLENEEINVGEIDSFANQQVKKEKKDDELVMQLLQ